VLTMPAAPVPIKGTIIDSTAFKTMPSDPRNLRPVANISGVMDDYKLLAFIAFKAGLPAGEDSGITEEEGMIIEPSLLSEL